MQELDQQHPRHVDMTQDRHIHSKLEEKILLGIYHSSIVFRV